MYQLSEGIEMKHQIATKAIAASSRRRLAGFISASAVFVVTVAATMACATNASAISVPCVFNPTLEKRWVWSNWSITYSTVVHNLCSVMGGTVHFVAVDKNYQQINSGYIKLRGGEMTVLGPTYYTYALDW